MTFVGAHVGCASEDLGLVGGLLYGRHGPEALFRAAGLAILASTAAAGGGLAALRARRKRRRELASRESLDGLAAAASL